MLCIVAKIYKYEKIVILSKNKKEGAYLQYVSIMCVKFQTDSSETVEEVDYKNLTSYTGHFSKISFEV